LSIRKNISFVFVSQILNTLIGFITSIIITRLLGAEGRGENAIFTNSVAFAVLVFGFSINSTIPYFINSGKAKAEELLSTILFFSILSTLLVVGTLFTLEFYGRINWVLSESIQGTGYKFIFTGIYITTLLTGVFSTYLLSLKKFRQVSIYGMVFQALPLLIYSLLYAGVIPYDHNTPFPDVVKIIGSVSALSFVAMLVLFMKSLPFRLSRKLMPVGLLKQFLVFSTMAYIGNVATFLNYKLDFWVVDEYCGKSDLGIYSLAAQLSQLLWILPSTMATVLYSYASKGSETEAIKYNLKLKQLAFYGTLVSGIIGSLLCYYFIPVLYGKEFTPAFNLILVFNIGIIPFSITIINASLFAARGNFKTSFVISVLIFLLSGITYFLMIPRYGLMGGAMASAMAYLIATLISEIYFCKRYKVSYFNLFQINKNTFSISGIFNK
jgi:O-antigen/teichoic acid export membrane protein